MLTQQCWPFGRRGRGLGTEQEERVAAEERPWWCWDGAAGELGQQQGR